MTAGYRRTERRKTMSRAAKIWIIAAFALILIGGAVFAASMQRNGWDFGSLGSGKLVTRTADVGERFDSISIKSDTEDIAFLPSEDGKCRVVFEEREKEPHNAAVIDGVLNIESKDLRSWAERVSFFGGSMKIAVYLPETVYVALSIDETTGDIAIPADFGFDSIDIKADTGDVDCRASARTLRVRTSTGDIRAEGIDANEIELAVSTGRVEVANVSCRGGLSITVSTGRAFLADVKCGSFSTTGSTGDITLRNVGVDGLLKIERSTGDVRFDRCDAAELEIETDTGSVTGTLLTEKVFIVKSDTGRIDVPESVTGGKCRVTTDTGDVKIEIGE